VSEPTEIMPNDDKLYGYQIQKLTHDWKVKHQKADEIFFHKDGTVMGAFYVSPAGEHHDWLKELFKLIRKRMSQK